MEKVRLGDVCEILDHKRVPITSSERIAGEYPYYGANGIQGYIADYIFDDELVLLAEDGGNFGSKDRPIAYRVSGKCWVNNHAHVLKPKDNIDVDYLCYSLMFYDTTGMVNGATRQKLTQSAMRQMTIPIVSISEQKEIVFKLNSLETLITKHKKQLEKLDELIKVRFAEMFGDWENTQYDVKTLEEICNIIKDGTHYTPTYTDESSGVRFLSSKDVVTGYINWTDNKFIIPELHEELRARIAPQKGDILLAKNGTTGICAIVDKDEVFDIYVSLALLRCKPGHNIIYMWAAINMPETKKQFDERLKGVGVPNLHLSEIKQTKVIVPPIDLQNQFAVFVEQVDKAKLAVKKSLEKAEYLKSVLMQKYFE